jgi:predicted mannosyl-3-phosphoglycerate phosphatase (HAD superfamily)
MVNVDKEAIKQVIEKAYIQGIHGNQDKETAESGFYRDFAMLVLQDNALEKVRVDEWLARVEVMKRENPDMWAAETRHTFELVDVTGYAAVAKLQVHKGATHFSTDYMLLYRFREGWRIVSKIFAIPS